MQEEIGIAEDLTKELQDPRFIIPLRLENFKKLFGIGELQYIDFTHSWASGLRDLLDTLNDQGLPLTLERIAINPNWENYKRRLATNVEQSQEVLISNWLRVAQTPDAIHYYQPTDAVNHILMEETCRKAKFPAEMYMRGFFSFATPEEIDQDFVNVGKFIVRSTIDFPDFIENGSDVLNIRSREARNLVSSMFRKSWENFCHEKGLSRYAFANNQIGFHVTSNQVPIRKKVSWGNQDERRSAMLHNIVRKKVYWCYGVSTTFHFWPFAHFRLKSRVLFADPETNSIFDTKRQHRLRRSICKGWRNKTWHGRLMAFLEILSGESEYIEVPLCRSGALKIEAAPVLVKSPVTTDLPNTMSDDAEEPEILMLENYDMLEERML